MTAVPVPAGLYPILFVLVLAFAVRVVVDVWIDVPYSILLLLVGVAVSVFRVDIGIRLTTETILAVVLPIVLFNGAIELNRAAVRETLGVVAVLVVVGIPLAVLLLGGATSVAFGLPVLVSLLLATIIVPTDPVVILSLFEEIDAPDRLTVIIESESLFNDGVVIVLFAVFASVVADRSPTAFSLELANAAVGEFLLVGAGGFVVGTLIGYGGTRVVQWIQERMAILLLTVLVAYGSYVLAEVIVGVSGILATVGAGLAMETMADTDTTDDGRIAFVQEVWEAGAFFLSTLVYLLLGAQVELGSVLQYWREVVVAAILVLLVRAAVVYLLVGATNGIADTPVPWSYQHVLVWGGLHTVVPIALALGLPQALPQRAFVQAVVFGVAIFGAIVQGLLLPSVVRITGLHERVSRPDPPDQ